MKKWFILRMVIPLILGISACEQKPTDEVNPKNSVLEANLRVNFSKLPLQEQRVRFWNLSSKDRLALWNDKFTQVMQYEWTPEQKSHIRILVQKMDASWFEKEENLEADKFLDKWVADARAIFNRDDLKKIGTTLSDYSAEKYPSGLRTTYEVECECNRRDDWCWGSCGSTCTFDSSWGCGWLLRKSCNGACS